MLAKKYENKNSGSFTVFDSCNSKCIRSKDINLNFRKKDGYTEMFGTNEESYSPVGSFIADIEITTSCNGVPDPVTGIKVPCPMCYKANNPTGTYMNLETYKKVLNTLNQNNTITQVALGIDADAETNPDLEEILKFTRSIGIVPNLTVANLTKEKAEMLVKYCGAISVSKYANTNVCYDTIKLLSDVGLEQINMHFCIHADNFDDAMSTISDIQIDYRLSKLNAIVFLSLKQKGRGIGFKPLSQEKFNVLYKKCMDNKISMGSDSCGCGKLVNASIDYGNYEFIKDFAESCESGNFSLYSSVKGEFFPCSFIEKTVGWESGIDLTADPIDFLDDVWYSDRTVAFRNKLLGNKDCNGCRQCPVYKI